LINQNLKGFDQPEPEGVGELDFSKAVPNTIECVDHVEAAVHYPKLFAHSLDVAINGSFVDMNIIAIGGIHQCVAAFYHSWAARQQVPSGMRLKFGGAISGNMRLSFQAARSIG
jgi:hypothetical protein